MMMMMSSWCVLAASIGTVLAIPPWAFLPPPPMGGFPTATNDGGFSHPPPPMDGSPIPSLPYPPPPFKGGRRPPPPPGFDLLPEDVRAKLTAIHENRTMEWREKQAQIDAIIQSLPASIRDKLPPPPPMGGFPPPPPMDGSPMPALPYPPPPFKGGRRPPPPPGFDLLPEDVRAQLTAIHENRTMEWHEKHAQIDAIMKSLPASIRDKLPPPPPMGGFPPPPPMDGSPIPSLPYPPPPFKGGRRPPPPPGFDLLPEDVRAKLTAIHENRTMEWREKQAQIDAIMQSLPASIRDKLPPPPGFALLPREVQTEYKSIMSNKSLNWEQRHNHIRQLLEKLPDDIKSKMPPPPMPPAFEMLPASIRNQLRAIHENRELGFRERYQKIKEVIDKLPDDIKSKLPQPPPPPPMFQ